MAFTKSERTQIRERDIAFGRKDNPTEGCNFPHDMADNVPCVGRLEVHHVLPQMFGYTYLVALVDDVDAALNGITVCQNSHTGAQTYPHDNIHNDQPMYWSKYRLGEKGSFTEMQDRRRRLAEAGKPYWNTKFDAVLLYQARANTREGNAQGWKFVP